MADVTDLTDMTDAGYMIDYSARHDVLILDEDGTLRPMDEPYFRAKKVAGDTWQILSDGDFSYLAAGTDHAISIDTGYGAGNIREFEQTLTPVPVRFAANTHDHFDHTAGNAYFEAVYMSRETQPLAGIPYPSFEGISFPKAKKVLTIGDGDVIELGDRRLEAIFMPDHAVGSLLFLDRKMRILFAGDEVQDFKRVNGNVSRVRDQLKRLAGLRSEFDMICAGPGIFPADIVEDLYKCAELILSGSEGERVSAGHFEPLLVPGYEGRTIYKRRGARKEDLPAGFDREDPNKRIIRFGKAALLYDVNLR